MYCGTRRDHLPSLSRSFPYEKLANFDENYCDYWADNLEVCDNGLMLLLHRA